MSPARDAASHSRPRAKAVARAAIAAATRDLDRGAIGEAAWHERVTGALATAYLSEDDPRWQSGFDGDALLWREARELVLHGVHRDGTFLDIGCATGHLMECLATWALERGRHLTIYGLELSPDLARAARRRLPESAERIFDGNATDWDPPIRFTYVRTSLEYVPARRESSLIARLLRDLVEPRGRLIIGPVDEPHLEGAVAACAGAGFAKPAVGPSTDRNGKTRHVLWIDASDGVRQG